MTNDDERRDHCRGERAAQSEPAVADRLVEKIADRGAERPRQDEGGPEQETREILVKKYSAARIASPAPKTRAPPLIAEAGSPQPSRRARCPVSARM